MNDIQTNRTCDVTRATPHRTRRWRLGAGVVGLALLLSSVSASASPADQEGDTGPEFESHATAQSGPTPRVLSQTPLRPDGRFSNVAVTNDGKFALVLGQHSLQKVRLTPGEPRVVGVTRNVFGLKVVVHPNGRFAYALGDWGNPIYVVDISKPTPRLVRTIMPNIAVMDLVVAPGGRFLYVKSGRTDVDISKRGLYVFSLERPGRPERVGFVRRWDEGPGEIAITRNGKTIITTNSWGEDYIYRYDVSTPRRPTTLGGKRKMPFQVDQITVSPDGRHTYVSGMRQDSPRGFMVAKLRTSDLAIMQSRGPLPAGGADLEVRPDSQFVVAAGWEAVTDAGFFVFQSQPFRRVGTYSDLHPSVNRSLAFSYGGDTRGRFYQVVNDGSDRWLIASRLGPGS